MGVELHVNKSGIGARALGWVVKSAGLALLYAFAGYVGKTVDLVQEDARVLFPQSGVALAGLLIVGVRYWPAVFVGSLFLTHMAEYSQAFALAVGFCNTLEAVVGAWVLRRFFRFQLSMGRLHDIYAFLVIGVLAAPLLTAFLTAGSLTWIEHHRWSTTLPFMWRRMFGHAIANLIVAPVLVTWSRWPVVFEGGLLGGTSSAGKVARSAPRQIRLLPEWSFGRIAEGLLLTLLCVWVSLLVFTNQSSLGTLRYPMNYAPFPFVVWAALRFGRRGASTAVLLITAIALYGTSKGFGPFIRPRSGEELVLLQMYLTVMAVSGLFLAAAISEHRTAQQQLMASREQLRALSSRLQIAREEERKLIAREVHDELGQQLTGIKMGLHAVARKLPPEADSVLERCNALQQLTDEAVKSVRRIASDLRPGILDDLGIVASMQWLAGEFSRTTGIPAHFECSFEDLSLDSERSTALFRILQESLTNITRHAQATEARIRFFREKSDLVLEVADNGRGIPEGIQETTNSLGLVGMKERAMLLGGQVSVSGTAGQGTVVRAAIPG